MQLIHFFSCIYRHSLRTAYRVASYSDNLHSSIYHSLGTAYRVARYLDNLHSYKYITHCVLRTATT